MDKFNEEAQSQIPPDFSRRVSDSNMNNESNTHSPTRVEINSKIRGSQQDIRSSKYKRNSQQGSQSSSKQQVRRSVQVLDKTSVLNSKKYEMSDHKTSKRGSKPSITSKFSNEMIALKSQQNISSSHGYHRNRKSSVAMSSSQVSQIFYMGMDLLNSNNDIMVKCEDFDEEEVLDIGIRLNEKRQNRRIQLMKRIQFLNLLETNRENNTSRLCESTVNILDGKITQNNTLSLVNANESEKDLDQIVNKNNPLDIVNNRMFQNNSKILDTTEEDNQMQIYSERITSNQDQSPKLNSPEAMDNYLKQKVKRKLTTDNQIKSGDSSLPNLEDLPLNEETEQLQKLNLQNTIKNTEDDFKVSQQDSMSNTIQSKEELQKVGISLPIMPQPKNQVIITKDSMGKNSIISECDSAFEEQTPSGNISLKKIKGNDFKMSNGNFSLQIQELTTSQNKNKSQDIKKKQNKEMQKKLVSAKKSTSTNENYLKVTVKNQQEYDQNHIYLNNPKSKARKMQTTIKPTVERNRSPFKKSPTQKSKGGLTQCDQESITTSRKFANKRMNRMGKTHINKSSKRIIDPQNKQNGFYDNIINLSNLNKQNSLREHRRPEQREYMANTSSLNLTVDNKLDQLSLNINSKKFLNKVDKEQFLGQGSDKEEAIKGTFSVISGVSNQNAHNYQKGQKLVFAKSKNKINAKVFSINHQRSSTVKKYDKMRHEGSDQGVEMMSLTHSDKIKQISSPKHSKLGVFELSENTYFGKPKKSRYQAHDQDKKKMIAVYGTDPYKVQKKEITMDQKKLLAQQYENIKDLTPVKLFISENCLNLHTQFNKKQLMELGFHYNTKNITQSINQKNLLEYQLQLKQLNQLQFQKNLSQDNVQRKHLMQSKQYIQKNYKDQQSIGSHTSSPESGERNHTQISSIIHDSSGVQMEIQNNDNSIGTLNNSTIYDKIQDQKHFYDIQEIHEVNESEYDQLMQIYKSMSNKKTLTLEKEFKERLYNEMDKQLDKRLALIRSQLNHLIKQKQLCNIYGQKFQAIMFGSPFDLNERNERINKQQKNKSMKDAIALKPIKGPKQNQMEESRKSSNHQNEINIQLNDSIQGDNSQNQTINLRISNLNAQDQNVNRAKTQVTDDYNYQQLTEKSRNKNLVDSTFDSILESKNQQILNSNSNYFPLDFMLSENVYQQFLKVNQKLGYSPSKQQAMKEKILDLETVENQLMKIIKSAGRSPIDQERILKQNYSNKTHQRRENRYTNNIKDSNIKSYYTQPAQNSPRQSDQITDFCSSETLGKYSLSLIQLNKLIYSNKISKFYIKKNKKHQQNNGLEINVSGPNIKETSHLFNNLGDAINKTKQIISFYESKNAEQESMLNNIYNSQNSKNCLQKLPQQNHKNLNSNVRVLGINQKEIYNLTQNIYKEKQQLYRFQEAPQIQNYQSTPTKDKFQYPPERRYNQDSQRQHQNLRRTELSKITELHVGDQSQDNINKIDKRGIKSYRLNSLSKQIFNEQSNSSYLDGQQGNISSDQKLYEVNDNSSKNDNSAKNPTENMSTHFARHGVNASQMMSTPTKTNLQVTEQQIHHYRDKINSQKYTVVKQGQNLTNQHYDQSDDIRTRKKNLIYDVRSSRNKLIQSGQQIISDRSPRKIQQSNNDLSLKQNQLNLSYQFKNIGPRQQIFNRPVNSPFNHEIEITYQQNRQRNQKDRNSVDCQKFFPKVKSSQYGQETSRFKTSKHHKILKGFLNEQRSINRNINYGVYNRIYSSQVQNQNQNKYSGAQGTLRQSINNQIKDISNQQMIQNQAGQIKITDSTQVQVLDPRQHTTEILAASMNSHQSRTLRGSIGGNISDVNSHPRGSIVESMNQAQPRQ